MILDSLAHAALYRPLSPAVARGLDWLAHFTPATADGRYDIDGDNVYALVQRWDPLESTCRHASLSIL